MIFFFFTPVSQSTFKSASRAQPSPGLQLVPWDSMKTTRKVNEGLSFSSYACNTVGTKDTFVENKRMSGTQGRPERWWFGKQTGIRLGIFTKWLRSSALTCEGSQERGKV